MIGFQKAWAVELSLMIDPENKITTLPYNK